MLYCGAWIWIGLVQQQYVVVTQKHNLYICCLLIVLQVINLGTFATEEEAARVWNEAALLFRGRFADMQDCIAVEHLLGESR